MWSRDAVVVRPSRYLYVDVNPILSYGYFMHGSESGLNSFVGENGRWPYPRNPAGSLADTEVYAVGRRDNNLCLCEI